MLYRTQAVTSCKVSGPYEVFHITSNNSDFYKEIFIQHLFICCKAALHAILDVLES